MSNYDGLLLFIGKVQESAVKFLIYQARTIKLIGLCFLGCPGGVCKVK
jgi:hypothetical protein